MSEHQVWVVRHGETEWSRDHRHTSTTDLPLTDLGIKVAESLRPRLAQVPFEAVFASPRTRARHTAELAGFPDAVVEEDLAEWDYGDYEGITTATIRETVPRWTVWTHPTPGGESAEQITERLDRVVERVQAVDGNVLLFGHGHALRAMTARWLGLTANEGRLFRLDTATLSSLGFERGFRVILRWNS